MHYTVPIEFGWVPTLYWAVLSSPLALFFLTGVIFRVTFLLEASAAVTSYIFPLKVLTAGVNPNLSQ